MVNVYDNDGNVVARVKSNSNLDIWDGRNYTNGGTGKHLGLTKLKKSKKFVLIFTSQWEGDRDYGEVVSDEFAFAQIARSESWELLDKYPELKVFETELDSDDE